MDFLSADIIRFRAIPIFMLVIGIGMSAIWLRDILSGKFSEQGSFFLWIEGENKLWPHILVEFLTSLSLMAGAIGLLLNSIWAIPLSLLSYGAVIYSSINSSGWVLKEKGRLPYGIPIWISLVGILFCAIFLVR